MEVGPERFGDLLAEERADAAAVDATHELALQVPLGDRVVADCGSGLPPQHLLGEVRADLVPLVEVRRCERRVEAREPGAVTHHVPHEHAVLAALRELGPVLRDRRVEVEQAAVGEHQHAERCHRLRARVHVDDRVLDPRVTGRVPGAAPQVDDGFTVDRQRDARAHFESGVEVAFERATNRFEPGLTHTVGVHLRDGRRVAAPGRVRASGRPAAGCRRALRHRSGDVACSGRPAAHRSARPPPHRRTRAGLRRPQSAGRAGWPPRIRRTGAAAGRRRLRLHPGEVLVDDRPPRRCRPGRRRRRDGEPAVLPAGDGAGGGQRCGHAPTLRSPAPIRHREFCCFPALRPHLHMRSTHFARHCPRCETVCT